jgi:hypothetical protein
LRKMPPLRLEGCFLQTKHSQCFTWHEHILRAMRHVMTTWISRMRPKSIRSATCRILPLFAHFHASTVSHFSFLDCLARLVGMMRTPAPFGAFQADAIRFQEAKASQADGSFKLSLDVSVKYL